MNDNIKRVIYFILGVITITGLDLLSSKGEFEEYKKEIPTECTLTRTKN